MKRLGYIFFIFERALAAKKKKNREEISRMSRQRCVGGELNLRNPENGSDSMLVSYKDTHEVSLVTNMSPPSSPNSNVTPEWAAGNRA